MPAGGMSQIQSQQPPRLQAQGTMQSQGTMQALGTIQALGTMQGYDPASFFCEMLRPGQPQHPTLSLLMTRLAALPIDSLRRRAAEAERWKSSDRRALRLLRARCASQPARGSESAGRP